MLRVRAGGRSGENIPGDHSRHLAPHGEEKPETGISQKLINDGQFRGRPSRPEKLSSYTPSSTPGTTSLDLPLTDH